MGAIEKLRASFRRQQTAPHEDKGTSVDARPAKNEGEAMTTTATVESAVKHSGEKEKAEKRRALGRGLDSLLPGPRAVSVIGSVPAPGTSPAGTQPSPHFVRSDKAEGAVAVMQAVAEEAVLPAETGTESGTAVPAGPGLRPTPGEGISLMPQADSRLPLVMHVAIADIDRNPFQTRHVETDEALEELTNSIKANGVLQPIVVRPAPEDGRYTLILGERRRPNDSIAIRSQIRLQALHMVARANASHIGSALSMTDIVAALYGAALILGHGSSVTCVRM